MKCKDIQDHLASPLDAAGERARSRDVDAHLAGCASCRAVASSLSASRQALRELRDQSIEGLVFDEIRRRVLGSIAAGPQTTMLAILLRRRMLWALAATLLVAAGALMLSRISGPRGATPQVTMGGSMNAAGPSHTAMRASDPVPTQPVSGRPAAPSDGPALRGEGRSASLTHPSPPAGARVPSRSQVTKQLTVKLLTDDPRVVIYMIIDQKES